MSVEMEIAFGLELELLLLDAQSHRPLLCNELKFEHLRNLVDAIDNRDVSLDGLNIKPLHVKASHYLIEGYYLTDAAMKPLDLLPKGVEIRTPIFNSIDATIDSAYLLYGRLQKALAKYHLTAGVLGHHPTAPDLDAPPNYDRHDYWQWALAVASTYGPDINISLPTSLSAGIKLDALNGKVNYYMPALVALSLYSPIYLGDLWRVDGRTGSSIRTFRRSKWAPMHYIHEKPYLRFEFKGFEMASRMEDYKAFFLFGLAILLDDKLTGTESDDIRMRDLGQVAVDGVRLDWVRTRCEAVLASADKIASDLGINGECLLEMRRRLARRWMPADDVIAEFETHHDIQKLMARLPALHRTKCKVSAG